MLLIIILVMAVVSAVGLSVMSRSITNVRVSKEEASSQKALAAAEAGIERILKTNTNIPIGTSFSGDPNTTYGANVNSISGNEILVNGGNVIAKDEGADIWLVAHNPSNDPDFTTPWSGNLTIFWGSSTDVCSPDPATNTMSALEVLVISGSQASPVLTRNVFDPCASIPSRKNFNSFSASSGGGVVNGNTFSNSATLPAVASGLVVRVIPLYTGSSVGVIASAILPSQGINIDSTGDSGGTKRKIKVFRGYPQLPIQYFAYGLFSP